MVSHSLCVFGNWSNFLGPEIANNRLEKQIVCLLNKTNLRLFVLLCIDFSFHLLFGFLWFASWPFFPLLLVFFFLLHFFFHLPALTHVTNQMLAWPLRKRCSLFSGDYRSRAWYEPKCPTLHSTCIDWLSAQLFKACLHPCTHSDLALVNPANENTEHWDLAAFLLALLLYY